MKIVIADDETPIREWIQFSIERAENHDFQIVGTAMDGREAYDLVMQMEADILITDIRMPGMDGIELMKKIHRNHPRTGVIVLTNYADFSYAREALSYGARKYLLKSELTGGDIVQAITELSGEMGQEKESTVAFFEHDEINPDAAHLDRELVLTEYRELIDHILLESREQLMLRIDSWFFHFQRICPDDEEWAIRRIHILVGRLEDIIQEHINGSMEDVRGSTDTKKSCQKTSKALIMKIYDSHAFSYSQTVREAMRYIYMNYTRKDLSLKDASTSIFRSPEYLSRVFHNETGMTFTQFLSNYRVQIAKKKLQDTEDRIYEIAEEVGFATPSYFARVFRENTGMTPESYRDRYR